MSASGKSVIFSKCNYFWLLLRFIMVTIVHYIKIHFKKRAKLVIIYVRTFCKHLGPQWSSIITRKIASKNSTKSWFQALIDLDYHDFPCQITVIMVKWGHFYSVLTLEKIPSIARVPIIEVTFIRNLLYSVLILSTYPHHVLAIETL